MRELFFDKHYGDSNPTRELDADELDEKGRYHFSVRERAVLHALRGRRKKSRASSTQSFFAPAYPQLAERGWLGKNRERVINNFLFGGPVSQHLWNRGQSTQDGKRRQQELGDRIWRALLGANSCLEQGMTETDILAAAIGSPSFDADGELPTRNFHEKTNSDSVMTMAEDELANRVTHDLVAICDLESDLPRMQWLQLLMTFLRFALPMWLLAQMEMTVYLRECLLDAVDEGTVRGKDAVIHALTRRNRRLLHPTLTPTRELFEHIEQYMKCRVELSILVHCLENVRKDKVSGRSLVLSGAGSNVISVPELLRVAGDAADDIRAADRFKEIAGGLDVRTFLTREGEQFAAWRNPLMRGQGKNIDEFFRVLYRAEIGDEAGGYLLAPEGRGAKRGFRVFPGQLLLKTVTYLAATDKSASRTSGGAGKLILQDVEEHFGQYGIDFSAAADARPLMMRELQAMGLLTGSPDAGSSVAIAPPY